MTQTPDNWGAPATGDPERADGGDRRASAACPDGSEGGGSRPGLLYGLQLAAPRSEGLSAWGPVFPSSSEIAVSTTAFRRVDAPQSDLEGARTWSLSVTAGTVALSASDPVRAARAAEVAVHRHRRDVDDLAASLTDHGWESVGRGREIAGWSRKSRALMTRRLAELDYSPIVAEGSSPVMLTLTYPREWEVVAPTGRAVKAHLERFRRRFCRRWGTRWIVVWKLEFQARGAPHLHLWLPSPGPIAEFRRWAAATWADVVDHQDPDERGRHEVAGVGVDVVSGLAGRDPKRLAIYFTKHNSPGMNKEYQHVVPQIWRAPGAGPGRFWGYAGLERREASVLLSDRDWLRCRRIIRRWSRSRASYAGGRFPSSVGPRVARMRVQRGTRPDGSPRYRWATVRRPLMGQAGARGGFALVNQGPDFARSLARAVAVWES